MFREKAIAAGLIFLIAVASSAQDAPFEGAVSTQGVTPGDLLPQMSAAAAQAMRRSGSEIAWIGYSIAVRDRFKSVFSNGVWLNNWYFIGSLSGSSISGRNKDGIERIGSDTKAVVLLYRQAAGGAKLEKIGVFDPSEHYRFRAPLVWLNGVSEAQSIAAYQGIAEAKGGDYRDEALMVLAMHRSDEGLRFMRSFILSDADEDDREDALRWWGVALMDDHFDEITAIAGRLKGEGVREELADLYFIAGTDASARALMSMARNDADEDVREDAASKLGLMAGRKLAERMEISADSEPELSEEDKHAIYVLSRMESKRGREALLKLVRTGKSYGVRKNALFWLTREEPNEEVLSLLEEILFGG